MRLLAVPSPVPGGEYLRGIVFCVQLDAGVVLKPFSLTTCRLTPTSSESTRTAHALFQLRAHPSAVTVTVDGVIDSVLRAVPSPPSPPITRAVALRSTSTGKFGIERALSP